MSEMESRESGLARPLMTSQKQQLNFQIGSDNKTEPNTRFAAKAGSTLLQRSEQQVINQQWHMGRPF